MNEEKKEMAFLKHLEDLRGCLIRALIGTFAGFLVAYYFADRIFGFLVLPFSKAYMEVLRKEPNLIYTTLFEPFMAYLKIGFVFGIFIASPYILYEMWRFIAPGLYKKEKKLIAVFVSLGVLFFLGGAAVAYFLMFPPVFKFFIGYSTEFIQPAIKVSDYLKVCLGFLLIFGAVFEFPLVIISLVYLKIISPRSISTNSRYIIIAIALASAIFTPADPISMLAMMIPLLILFLLTLAGAYVIDRFSKK